MSGPLRVLLVDDDEDDYRLTRELFADFDPDGFRLDWVATYRDGLAAMLRGEHDVYLLDYRLGGRTGLDLLREAIEQGCYAPAIILTGRDERAVDVEAMRAGAADYLIKSGLDAAVLERSIRYALQQNRHEEALRRSHDALEQRVQERTAELAHINQALEAEIAERKRAEAELTEVDRLKDEFLAMLAHELRNPLAPLLHGLEVLRIAQHDPVATLAVREMMERQLRKMTRLVDDLLDVSRITSGKIELRQEVVDVIHLVNLAAESVQQFVEARRQELRLQVPTEPILLEGDFTRLEQVVSNLLSNASKYTQAGGRITLALEREATHVTIRVSDTGMGMSRDTLPKVFDLFMQVDRSLDRSQGGLGIGLTLVRRLVDLHGGTVEATSQGLGQGSQFIVRLPLTMSPAAVAATSVAAAPARSTATAAPRRVLVVDDNLDLVRSLGLMLDLKGFEVQTASDGPTAIEAARRFHPQAILLDIGLPGMNGYEAAQHLRQEHPRDSVLMIALSGYGRDEDRQKSLKAGFDLHLVKPIDTTALMNALATVPGCDPDSRSA